MLKRYILAGLTFALIAALLMTGAGSVPTYAQGSAPATADNCADSTNRADQLAQVLGVPAQQILDWHCVQHKGYGEIRNAYLLAKLTAGTAKALTVEQIFSMRAEHQGWGQIIKASGISNKDFRKAMVKFLKDASNQGGNKGKAGKQDDKDDKGDKGNNGNKGNKGNKGNNGNKGNKGNNGNKGQDDDDENENEGSQVATPAATAAR
jgi:hypothetical protein